jgi:hypothetical protein
MPELSRAILGLASFITIGSLLMLFVVRPGTGEFVISIAALVIGVGMGAVAVVVHLVTNRNSTKQSSVRLEEEK